MPTLSFERCFKRNRKRTFRFEILRICQRPRLNYPGRYMTIIIFLEFRWMKSVSLVDHGEAACLVLHQPKRRADVRIPRPRSEAYSTCEALWERAQATQQRFTKIKQILTPVETVLVPLCFPEIRTESSFVRMSYSGRHLSPEWRECSNSFLRRQNKLVSVMLAACPITANNGIW